MLSRYFGSRIHTQIHLFLLCSLAASVVCSKAIMSVGMVLLLLNLIVERDYSKYWENIRKSRLLLWIISFFVLHILSLAWSTNLDYGIHDIKAKLPFIVLPLVLTAKPLSKRSDLRYVLGIFLASVLFVTLFNFISYQQIFGNRNYDDIRGMSLFDSHVRLSLMVAMAIVVAVQLYRWKALPVFLMLAIVVWLHFYTYFSQVLSGAMVLIAIYCAFGFYWLYRRYKIFAFSGLIIIIVSISSSMVWLFSPITYNKNDYDFTALRKETTKEGNLYTHKLGEVSPETGKPIDIYICHPELKREWNKISKIPYDGGRDVKGQLIYRTLIRYMASKDLKKDAEGIKSLSKNDIQAIEKGHSSIYYRGIWSRFYGLRYQLSNVTDPNGHSLLQRLEYWKTGIQIAQQNWIFGTGTGDVQDVFNSQYDKNNSKLLDENRNRSHNMYITILLSLGIPGLFLLLISHFEFLKIQFSKGELVGFAFIIIILVSYLVEDTLETQSGVTFFGLFFGLFIVPFKKESKS